jgi:thiol-disulfide isomerase/thioredoxin
MGGIMTIRSLCFLLIAAAICGLLICTSADVLCAQESAVETGDTASEADLNCLPGDPTPALAIREWMQQGVYDEVAPADGRLITVIEFWASWCPLCRAVLPLHDDLQAQLKRKGVRFLAISPEEPEDVRAFLRHAGLEHLALACDDGEATLNSFRTLEQDMLIPFAVIIEEDESTGAARMLWKGPVITYEDSLAWSRGYTHHFDDVLASVLAGRFDVEAARETETCREELARLKEQIERSGGQPRQVGPLAEQINGRDWPAECNDLAVSALAIAAMLLATAEDQTEDEAALALKLVWAAIEANEEEHHALLHILARALFENGKTAEAVAAERKAVESYEDGDGFTKADYLEALARYEQALAAQEGEAAGIATEPEDQTQPKKAEQRLPVVPELISAEQAKEDLASLHEQLHLVYAGYDDATWRLLCAGSSWDEHNSAFLQRIEERTEWPLSDFIDLLSDYLRITNDRHLLIQAVYSQSEWRDRRPVSGCLPFFTDALVREEAGRRVLVEVPAELSHLQGAEIADIAVIPTPRTAELGRAYLFATLPRDPQQSDTKEYLLGLLADEAQDPPESVTVSLLTPGTTSLRRREQVALALHRGRVVFRGERDPAWSVDLEPVPVVSVRRMWGDGLEGIPGTAAQVRDRAVVVLDLRGNGGGSDLWAVDWCSRFTDQPLRTYLGYAGFRRGETDPLRRWDSRIQEYSRRPETERAEGTFRGRLFVLIDENVASSGETFAGLVSQIPGAVLLGEKTGGFLSYGNRAVANLPNSRLRVVCGPTKFVPAGRPGRERLGYFPDYWLDTDDPLAAIARFYGEPSS